MMNAPMAAKKQSDLSDLESVMRELREMVNKTENNIRETLHTIQEKDYTQPEQLSKDQVKERSKNRIIELKDQAGYMQQRLDEINKTITEIRDIVGG